MRKKLMFKLALPLACVVLSAVPSFANVITDTLIVYNVTNTIIAQVTAFGPGNGSAIYTLPPGFAKVSEFGNATVFCETLPCNASSPVTNFSDIVGIVGFNTPPLRLFGFSSDGGSGSGTPYGSQGAIFVLEQPGVPYNVTMYLDPALQRAGDTAWFTSYEFSTVPEPGTMVLLGTGLLGLMGVSRRFLR